MGPHCVRSGTPSGLGASVAIQAFSRVQQTPVQLLQGRVLALNPAERRQSHVFLQLEWSKLPTRSCKVLDFSGEPSDVELTDDTDSMDWFAKLETFPDSSSSSGSLSEFCVESSCELDAV
ncbi:hypothetical protein EYF80_023009 [Liparis tanakae]|uniref:Uncharacterized protein n=1 Tax=Liparis tanakae TaxID=230148 RepID=A0A4Z2HLY6_9TELE|nr:hypothetical protein EYF80_023009 [Liparis tanakae]